MKTSPIICLQVLLFLGLTNWALPLSAAESLEGKYEGYSPVFIRKTAPCTLTITKQSGAQDQAQYLFSLSTRRLRKDVIVGQALLNQGQSRGKLYVQAQREAGRETRAVNFQMRFYRDDGPSSYSYSEDLNLGGNSYFNPSADEYGDSNKTLILDNFSCKGLLKQ
jgi:hypothetical protein